LGSTQWQAFHDGRRDPLLHLPRLFSGRLTTRQVGRLIFWSHRCSLGQTFVAIAASNPAGENKPGFAVVPNKQSAEVFAAAFGFGVAVDNKFLMLSQFYLDPAPGPEALSSVQCFL
jgi:hypothetical protein